jgi:hypothetical protein
VVSTLKGWGMGAFDSNPNKGRGTSLICAFLAAIFVALFLSEPERSSAVPTNKRSEGDQSDLGDVREQLQKVLVPTFSLDGNDTIFLPLLSPASKRTVHLLSCSEKPQRWYPLGSKITLASEPSGDGYKLAFLEPSGKRQLVTCSQFEEGQLLLNSSEHGTFIARDDGSEEKSSDAPSDGVVVAVTGKASTAIENLFLLDLSGARPSKGRGTKLPLEPAIILNEPPKPESFEATERSKSVIVLDLAGEVVSAIDSVARTEKQRSKNRQAVASLQGALEDFDAAVKVAGLSDSAHAVAKLLSKIASEPPGNRNSWSLRRYEAERVYALLAQWIWEEFTESKRGKIERQAGSELGSLIPAVTPAVPRTPIGTISATPTNWVTPAITVTRTKTPTATATPAVTSTRTKTPTPIQATRTPTPASRTATATATPVSPPSKTATPTPTRSLPTATPTRSCSDYGLTVEQDDDPGADGLFSVLFRWRSVFGTNDFRLVVRQNGVTIRDVSLPNVLLYRDRLPAGRYKAWVYERDETGRYVPQCDGLEFEVPIAAQCPAFDDPTVSKVRDSSGKALFIFEKLKRAGVLWYEIIEIAPDTRLPQVPPEKSTIFHSPEQMACYEWANSSTTPGSNGSIFTGWSKKVIGSFSTDDPLRDLVSRPFAASHLVCLYVCPSCRGVVTAKPIVAPTTDDFIRGWAWYGSSQRNAQTVKTLTPGAGSTVTDLQPVFAWQAAPIGAAPVTYTLRVRKPGVGGAVVLSRSGLKASPFTPDTPLAPGDYVYSVLPSTSGATWSTPVAFTLSLPPPMLRNPGAVSASALPTFTWRKARNRSASYEVVVDDLTTNQRVIRATNVKSEKYKLSQKLAYGHAFEWSVRVTQGSFSGPWSRPFRFKTRPRKTQLESPRGETFSTRPIFSWSQVESDGDDIRYELWVNYSQPQQKIFSVVVNKPSYRYTAPFIPGKELSVWVRLIVNGIPEPWGPAVRVRGSTP